MAVIFFNSINPMFTKFCEKKDLTGNYCYQHLTLALSVTSMIWYQVQSTMRYKAVIFDLDGTLLDTLEDIADSCNRVLAEEGFPTHPTKQYRHFVGKGIQHLVISALPREVVSDNRSDLPDNRIIETIQTKLMGDYSLHCLDKTKPYPGIIKILGKLAKQGISMSILSNKPQEMVEKTVIKLLSPFKFTVVMGTGNGFPHKPDPRSTHYCVEQMKIPREMTVFTGDSDIDVMTAKNAGLFSIAVAWGFRSVEVLKTAGADVIIHQPAELLQFFSG